MKSAIYKINHKGIIGTVTIDENNHLVITAKDYSKNKQIYRVESNSIENIFEMSDAMRNENSY
jgi:hypothetical protein